jgi:perosamine synthetase
MTKSIKLFDPAIDIKEEKAIQNVLKSKFWASGAGVGKVLKFEHKFKEYVGSNSCVAVNSGTAALNLALSMVDIKNKEVILPSLSFVSSAHAVILNGGIPIFADVDPKTLCIDRKQIENLISSKTKIILPVHFGGMPCDLDNINTICKKNNIDLVEDAAHAAGSSYKNKKIGKYGKFVCFSFHPVKNLAMPTGGLISINDKNHKKICTSLLAKRWCGITDRKNSEYDVKDIGWNYYLNEFSAAIGLEQLKKLDRNNMIRKKIAKRYNQEFATETKMPYSPDCSYHLYWILVKNRPNFRKQMKEFGIETGIHYKPIHKMTFYKYNGKLPVTEKISSQIVSIPIHPNLSENDIEKIIHSVNKLQ